MELQVLRHHGWSIASLAREFGPDWRTAKRYATATAPPRYRPRGRPAELSAAGLAHVERRPTACPDLRATVLHRELVEGYGYVGSSTSLRRRVVELRLHECLVRRARRGRRRSGAAWRESIHEVHWRSASMT